MPLEHLVDKGGFTLEGDVFGLAKRVSAEQVPLLAELLHELVDWRLASYLSRRTSSRARLRVSHSAGRPIIRFDRTRVPGLPQGSTRLQAGDQAYEADFVKIALNVVREPGGTANVLPDLLWSWFGPDAGKPGTSFTVELYQDGGAWHLVPVSTDGDEAHQAGSSHG